MTSDRQGISPDQALRGGVPPALPFEALLAERPQVSPDQVLRGDFPPDLALRDRLSPGHAAFDGLARRAVGLKGPIAALARVLLVLALPAALALAQDPVDASGSPGTAALDRFLEEVDALTAEFQQELTGSDGRLLETAAGTLSLKRPNRFLWRYETPIEQLVIADGEQLWMYDVELAQATVTPLDSDNPSSPAMLLSGERDVRDGFDVVEDFARDGRDWIRLSPKPGSTDFQSVLIGFSGGLPIQLEFVDGLDQVTSITFSGIAVNPDLGDSAFEFAPPPDVDVIGGEG